MKPEELAKLIHESWREYKGNSRSGPEWTWEAMPKNALALHVGVAKILLRKLKAAGVARERSRTNDRTISAN